jgi:hypothetical protein
MVLRKGGKLYGWGYNASGQLGIGGHKKGTSPEPINFFTVDPCLAELGPVNPEISEIFDIRSKLAPGTPHSFSPQRGQCGVGGTKESDQYRIRIGRTRRRTERGSGGYQWLGGCGRGSSSGCG